jgi:hypothetical protein
MTDTRGQIGLVRFFAALVVGAFLSYFVLQVTDPILERASSESAGTAAAPATQWLSTGGDYLVVIFLVISFFGMIALALYQRGVGR